MNVIHHPGSWCKGLLCTLFSFQWSLFTKTCVKQAIYLEQSKDRPIFCLLKKKKKKNRCKIGLYKKSRDGKNEIIVAKLWLRKWRKGWIFTSEKDKSSLIPAWTSAIFLCSCQFFHPSKIIKTENYTFFINFKSRQRKKEKNLEDYNPKNVNIKIIVFCGW